MPSNVCSGQNATVECSKLSVEMAQNSCLAELRNPEEYSNNFFFEREKNYIETSAFMTKHFPKTWLLTFVYVVVIHAGQYYMKNRPPYQLRTALLLWNVLLAIYSIFAFTRVFGEMAHIYLRYGFYFSICNLHTLDHVNMMAFWTQFFAFSKVFELGDTAFIILRKTPLIFLHWYHHVATLLFVWYSCVNLSSMGQWFQVVNLFVHSIMYTYYAMKVLGFKLPRKVSMGITSIQLLQMAAGIFMTVYTYRAKLKGHDCCVDNKMIFSAWGMYLSYFVLFLNFFIKSYIDKKQRGDKTRKPKKVE